jgi:hypothetical protein
MPRSLATFRQRSGYGQPTAGSVVKSVLPDAEALHLSSVALKEHLGLAIYRLKGWS